MENLASRLLETVSAVTAAASCAEDFDTLSDPQLLGLQEALAECDRRLDVYRSHAARQVARRSRRELGHAGLAARNGFASPEALIQAVTKVTGGQAARLMSIGRLLDETNAAKQFLDDNVDDVDGASVAMPWEAPIVEAVSAGTLSVDCADALRRGLGQPNEQVTAEHLRHLAEGVLATGAGLSADRLFKVARNERDLADLEGIKARQQELYDRGGLRIFPRPDGMWRMTADLDPEAAVQLTSALDPLTSPRRGGPRFTSPGDIERAQRIIDDPRSTDRIALDGFLELIRLGVNADSGRLYGSVRPVVKIVVTQDDLSAEAGVALVEHSGQVVTADTAARILCNGDTALLTMDREGNPLDLGRTRRLFTGKQRDALAVRDGGCVWFDCEKPPSWTEAHHIEHWKRDHGKTDVRDGVLLCKFHHLQLHNNHWEIERRGDEYWLHAPTNANDVSNASNTGNNGFDSPVRLPSKSVFMKHLRRRNAVTAVADARREAAQ